MPDFLTDGFMPHGYCLKWDGPLVFAFIVGNLSIALAYFLIPLALRFFIGQRKDLPYGYMFKLFAAFILSCGITHIAKVLTLYYPAYWLEASVDLWTAGVSLLTAALLFPLIPKALALRSPRELEEANVKLQHEVLQKEKAQVMADTARREAEISRDAAIKADQLKSQFIASVSHEIRTPMSGVIGITELLAQDETLNEQAHSDVELVLKSSKRLLVILNDLLDFSKLETGSMQTEIIEFTIAELVEEVVELTRTTASSKDLGLEASIDKELPATMRGDQEKVRQVLLNLVNNAIKFTQKGGVSIVVAKREANVEFSVTDTGIGIEEEAQPMLFKPFVQADGSTKRKYGGSGLGLSIARQYVELMGGEIGFQSQGGAGSSFWFVVPLLGHEEQK